MQEGSGVFEELEGILGTDGANRLVDYYAGSSLYIPRGIQTGRKRRQIREEFKKGAGYRELAKKYGYTERHIRKITRRMPQGKIQGELFEGL
ncbi:MAG: hypothetical protein LBN21_04250 [Treponema sp.]|jgi:Mor family transcriptional regulator|nr:hypothetical protein [Treponema sp.]